MDYDLHVWIENDDVRKGAVEENCVYLDSAVDGCCCCSLQVTLQASDMDQARWLYDQLIPLGPIMLALTAANPIFKGYLTDVDVRWSQFGMAGDERTIEKLNQGVCFGAFPPATPDLRARHRASIGYPRDAQARTRCTYRKTLGLVQIIKIQN